MICVFKNGDAIMQNILSILILITVLATYSYSTDKHPIIVGDEYYGAGMYMKDYTLDGKKEKCRLTYETKGNTLIHKTCINLTNSKGIKIFCTENKEICKTEEEISNLFTSSKTVNSSKKIWVYQTTDGTEFETKFNKHGAVLKSKSSTLYLGKNCDASSPEYGNGEWEWANAGFEVRFKNTKIVFGGHQELPIDNEIGCGYSHYNKEENSAPEMTPKELCKASEDNFSKLYDIFKNAQLNPNETQNGILMKQIRARDSALVFIGKCKNIPRNILWNGGYDMDDIERFVIETNELVRIFKIRNNL